MVVCVFWWLSRLWTSRQVTSSIISTELKMKGSLLLVLVHVSLVLSGGKIFKPDQKIQYKFGDIISSTMTRLCGKSGTVIKKHYVVYVGDEPIAGKKAGQDIFHRWDEGPDGCKFGELSKGKDLQKAEEYSQETPDTTKDKIIARILDKKRDCGNYDILENNCETLATYVRFGKSMIQQKGTLAEYALKYCPGGVLRTCNSYKEMVNDNKQYLNAWKQCRDQNNNG
ncbi:hypothetical protein WMY93_030567 [Mugilogobius chulae]|uniref:LRAT domain-containing protein n=1 Tax=Mugilogobius chulae TaxID=88201 RepID=A0AAW0MHP4_9GOBI